MLGGLGMSQIGTTREAEADQGAELRRFPAVVVGWVSGYRQGRSAQSQRLLYSWLALSF
jgi:hypothetical protein